MQLNDRIDITHELLFHYRSYYSVPNVPLLLGHVGFNNELLGLSRICECKYK